MIVSFRSQETSWRSRFGTRQHNQIGIEERTWRSSYLQGCRQVMYQRRLLFSVLYPDKRNWFSYPPRQPITAGSWGNTNVYENDLAIWKISNSVQLAGDFPDQLRRNMRCKWLNLVVYSNGYWWASSLKVCVMRMLQVRSCGSWSTSYWLLPWFKAWPTVLSATRPISSDIPILFSSIKELLPIYSASSSQIISLLSQRTIQRNSVSQIMQLCNVLTRQYDDYNLLLG